MNYTTARLIAVFILFSFSQAFAQSNEVTGSDSVFTNVQQMPKYQGDFLKVFSDSFKYQQEVDYEGTMYVSFIVEKDGSINDIKIAERTPNGKELPDGGYKSEILRILTIMNSMHKWQSGIQDGKPVRVKYTMPIRFRAQ
jgi:protein TonB